MWLFARPSFHIGASGLVYALVGFIMLSGILRRQTPLIAISFLVVFLYGSLIWGVFPFEEGVSYEGHLGGALAGFALAIAYRKEGYKPKRYSWEEEHNMTSTPPQQQEEWRRYYTQQNGFEYHYKPKDKEN